MAFCLTIFFIGWQVGSALCGELNETIFVAKFADRKLQTSRRESVTIDQDGGYAAIDLWPRKVKGSIAQKTSRPKFLKFHYQRFNVVHTLLWPWELSIVISRYSMLFECQKNTLLLWLTIEFVTFKVRALRSDIQVFSYFEGHFLRRKEIFSVLQQCYK